MMWRIMQIEENVIHRGCRLAFTWWHKITNVINLRACLHEGGGPQVGEVACGGSPHRTCKRDHIKMRDYMDRRVTSPKQVTSPTWGSPPPYKQALIYKIQVELDVYGLNIVMYLEERNSFTLHSDCTLVNCFSVLCSFVDSLLKVQRTKPIH